MKVLKVAKSPHLSLVINFLYALFNCVIGFSSFSWWFVTLGAYYFVLAVARFSVLEVKRRSGGDAEMELFSKRITGILFIALSFCLIGIVILSAVKERGAEFHEIIMITIATYSFTKITMAIIGLSSARKSASPVTKTLRNISLADAFVSVYSMQRSMLVSFPGMRASNIRLFNVLTGTAVWILI